MSLLKHHMRSGMVTEQHFDGDAGIFLIRLPKLESMIYVQKDNSAHKPMEKETANCDYMLFCDQVVT